MITPLRRHPLCLALGAALGLQAPLVAAQIEEVVVTAQKREESLQTTPIAISAMTGDQMERMGITSFEEVAYAAPNLNLTPYPSSASLLILYMRGQGVSDPMQITSDTSVGLYQDGFYLSRPQASAFDLADIERVEVLRGPQGTLYGRNTTGGAVNLISKKPTGEFGLKQTLTAGNYNYFRSLTTVDLPEWQGLATKFTVLKSQKDGYVRNQGSSHDFGEKEELSGRLSLLWQPTDELTVDYFYDHGNIKSTPLYYQNGALNGKTMLGYPYEGQHKRRSRTYRPIDLPESGSRFEGHGLTLTWDALEQLTVKSLTGYRDLSWDTYQDYAEAFTQAAGFDFTSPIGSIAYDDISNHQFTQEFQFIGTALDGALDYVAGLYYFNESGSHYEQYIIDMPAMLYDNNQDPTLPPNIVPGHYLQTKDRWVSTTSKSHAVYGQATWTPPILDHRMDITLGARWTQDKRTGKRHFVVTDAIDGFSAPPEIDLGKSRSKFSRFNPALTVNYNWNDDLSTYAKVVTAYKAGGASEGSPLGNFEQTYAPEEVTSYEVGLKSHWLDRRLRLNAAAFYSKFDDMQLAFTADVEDLSIIQSYNAGKANVKGFELELLYAPIDDLTINMEYAWLDATMDKVKVIPNTLFSPDMNPASPYQPGQNIKKVFEVPYVSRDSVNLGIDYLFLRAARAEFSARLDYHFQSKNYNTATTGSAVPNRSNYQQPSYGVFNGRLTMDLDLPRGDQLRLSLWGKNIFNKKYPVHVLGLGTPVATPEVPVAGWMETAKIWNEPATYGVELVYQY